MNPWAWYFYGWNNGKYISIDESIWDIYFPRIHPWVLDFPRLKPWARIKIFLSSPSYGSIHGIWFDFLASHSPWMNPWAMWLRFSSLLLPMDKSMGYGVIAHIAQMKWRGQRNFWRIIFRLIDLWIIDLQTFYLQTFDLRLKNLRLNVTIPHLTPHTDCERVLQLN